MQPRVVPMSFSRRSILLAAMTATIAVAGSLVIINEARRHDQIGASSSPQSEVRIGAPFTLVDHLGRTTTDRDFRGRRMLLLFSSLADEDRTRAALQVISAALGELGAERVRIAPILVTTDPDQDTPERLAAAISGLDGGWTGLTGSARDVHELARAFHVALPAEAQLRKGAPPSAGAIAYLMDERGQFISHRIVASNVQAIIDWLRQTH